MRAKDINQFRIQHFLESLAYPIDKKDILNEAKENKLHPSIQKSFSLLPAGRYTRPMDISEALGEV